MADDELCTLVGDLVLTSGRCATDIVSTGNFKDFIGRQLLTSSIFRTTYSKQRAYSVAHMLG